MSKEVPLKHLGVTIGKAIVQDDGTVEAVLDPRLPENYRLFGTADVDNISIYDGTQIVDLETKPVKLLEVALEQQREDLRKQSNSDRSPSSRRNRQER